MTREREIDGSIKPAIPYLEYYTPSSDTPLVAWQWYPILWDIHWIITSDFTEKTDIGIFTDCAIIQTTGLYRIDFQLHIHDGEANASCKSHLLLNNVEVWSSVGYIYVDASMNVTLFTTITLYLKKDDAISCEWASDSITAIIQDDSVFRISYIPMLGWNNNQAGVAVNRGVRR